MGFLSSIGHAVSSGFHAVTHPRETFTHPGAAMSSAFQHAFDIAQSGTPAGMAFSAMGGHIPGAGNMPIPGMGGTPPNFASVLGGAVGALKNISGTVASVAGTVTNLATGQRQLQKDVDTAVRLNQRASLQITRTSKIVAAEAQAIGRNTKLIGGSFQLIGKAMADTNQLRKTVAHSFGTFSRAQHHNTDVLVDIDQKEQLQVYLITGGIMVGMVLFAVRNGGV